MSTRDDRITQVLQAAADGDSKAAAELLPLVYVELRKLAQARLAKTPPGNTLQPTALVHEAFMRLVGQGDPGWSGRGHFFGAAAQAMRDLLVEQARRKARLKRGGDRKRIDAEVAEACIESPSEDLVAIDEVLQRLEAEDPRKRQIVNLRYFAGLSNDEVAAALDLSPGHVRREWTYIKAWLKTQLSK